MLSICKGLLDWNCVVLVAAVLYVFDDTLTAVSLRILVGVELVHLLVLVTKAKFSRLVLDADPLVLGKHLILVH